MITEIEYHQVGTHWKTGKTGDNRNYGRAENRGSSTTGACFHGKHGIWWLKLKVRTRSRLLTGATQVTRDMYDLDIARDSAASSRQ